MSLFRTAAERKAQPVYSGVLAYFPDALLAVAEVSKLGNDQHNPGEPLHWAREKSMDQLDAAVRHLLDFAKGDATDADGGAHLAKAAWRILAKLQLECENQKRVEPVTARPTETRSVRVGDDAAPWKAPLGRPECLASAPTTGLICTRMNGHSGPHVACGSRTVLEVWE